MTSTFQPVSLPVFYTALTRDEQERRAYAEGWILPDNTLFHSSFEDGFYRDDRGGRLFKDENGEIKMEDLPGKKDELKAAREEKAKLEATAAAQVKAINSLREDLEKMGPDLDAAKKIIIALKGELTKVYTEFGATTGEISVTLKKLSYGNGKYF